MSITKSIRKAERWFDAKTERFVQRHPLLGFLLVFAGMPLFILACVCAGTAVLAVPMAWLFGWL